MSQPPAEPAVMTDLSDVIERARSLAARDGRTLLGITGAPGVGKSTLAQIIVDQLGQTARSVGMDAFHLSQSRLAELGSLERKGAIDTFDADGFLALMRRLRNGEDRTVYAPRFHRELEESITAEVAIEPEVRLVVVEGNYLLVSDEPWGSARELFDTVWFCERDEDDRLTDLAARHQAHGKSSAEALRWALGPDQRNADLVATTRSRADVIVRVRIPTPAEPVDQAATCTATTSVAVDAAHAVIPEPHDRCRPDL